MKFAKFAERLNKKGFTLIELIVVIAILAILAVTAVMAIGGVTDQARISTLTSDGNTAIRSLNLYNSLVASPANLTSVSTTVAFQLVPRDNTSYDTATLTDLALSTSPATGQPQGMINMELGLTITEAQWNLLFIAGEEQNGTDPVVRYDAANSGVWILTTADVFD